MHTLDLPAANRTQDDSITRLSMDEERVVITKDAYFVSSFLVHGQPHMLLLSTGNINTTELLELFWEFLPQLTKLFAYHSYLELSRTLLVTHR